MILDFVLLAQMLMPIVGVAKSGNTNFTNDPTLQAYWYMEQATGADASDGTINGNTLTNNASTAQSSTHVQGSYSAALNGTDMYFSITNAALSANFPGKNGTTTTDVTVGAWVQMAEAEPANNSFILRKGGNTSISLRQTAGGTCIGSEMYLDGGWILVFCNSGGSLNTWYHVVARLRGSTTKVLTLTIDGVVQNSTYTATSAVLATSTHDLNVGYDIDFGGTPFHGLIDEVFVFNRALSDSEISSIYLHGLDGSR